MSYYGYQQTRRDSRAEDEKAWRRAKATAWDERWHALSHKARLAFLHQMKATANETAASQPGSPTTSIERKVLDELVASGFARVEEAKGKKSAKVFPMPATADFSARLRALERSRLLGKPDRALLINYIRYAFFDQGVVAINKVIAGANIREQVSLEIGLDLYVTSHYWPGWVADQVKSAAARAVLAALVEAPGPVRASDLPGMIKGSKKADLTGVVDALLANLAIFEGLDPESLDIVVGLLPAVRKSLAGASQPRPVPGLIVCESPAEIGPMGGLLVNDLRVFLLEVAGQSPRLRQDGQLFVKEEPRFLDALPEWPGWVYEMTATDAPARVATVFDRARSLKFTEIDMDERANVLRLTGKGRNWLSSEMEDQYVAIYEAFRDSKAKPDPYGYDPSHGDSKYLGIAASVFPSKDKKASPYYSYREGKPEDRLALRSAIYRAFLPLKAGVFYRVTSILDCLSFGPGNPILVGKEAANLSIFVEERSVPPLPERIEAAGRRVISALLSRRLLPFDAMQVALDPEGNVCVAKLPRFEGFFGEPYEHDTASARGASRVIVQPDFSVIVIGLSPAPAADLAPFCERSSGRIGQGALTFKITRTSVIRAASQGLSADAIIARLKKYASVDVPANVLHEIRDWAGWIRLVNVRPMTIVRCPDAEAADRVSLVLGRRAERIGETLVGLNSSSFNPAEKLKLQELGVIITKEDIRALAMSKKDPAPTPTPTPTELPVAKRPRGRPKKAR